MWMVVSRTTATTCSMLTPWVVRRGLVLGRCFSLFPTARECFEFALICTTSRLKNWAYAPKVIYVQFFWQITVIVIIVIIIIITIYTLDFGWFFNFFSQCRSKVGAGPCARIPKGPLSSLHWVRLGHPLHALHTLLLRRWHEAAIISNTLLSQTEREHVQPIGCRLRPRSRAQVCG